MGTHSAEKVIPLPWIQSIIEKGQISDAAFFQLTDLLDWRKQGDDQAVLEPLILFLAELGDKVIFAFDDKMAELLYALDTHDIIDHMMEGDTETFSADDFLYARCVALVNGKQLYDEIMDGTRRLRSDIEYRPILYVPAKAWARLHNRERSEYPHKYSYEFFDSNGW